MENDEFFVRTAEEMYAAFPDHPDAVARTQEIAERVDIDLDLSSRHFPVFTPPGVRVEAVTLRDVPFSVTSQGTVRPRTESQLVTEIAGRVTSIAPSFAEGGFFESGDVLVTVDPFDYQQAMVSARSQVAQARLRLAQEEAEAEVAVREWDTLGRGDPRALTLRKPQLEEARASVAGAEAGLERAERDLERADIVAP